ncbi:MAG: DUF2160 family membrane protein [Nitrososphaeria archaeon]
MLEFMYFVPQTIVLVIFLISLFTTLAVLDMKKRSYARKGFLPIPTSRGDRIFFSILFTVITGFLWLKFTSLPMEFALLIGIVISILVLKYG